MKANKSRKIRIKDIAELAEVSPGTVDRVLHNRGNVSPAARIAVEKVLDDVNYKPNLYLSSISIKKCYNIAISTPQIKDSEYWLQIHQGINRAIKSYSSISINCQYFYYDQYDLYSCRSTFEKLLNASPDAVIIGPTFKDETIVLTNRLSDQNIPYIFVDSMVEGTTPLAFFSANQYSCGYLIARLLAQITEQNADYVLFQATRIGDASANNTILRKIGFMDYFKAKGSEERVIRQNFSVSNPKMTYATISDFFKTHPTVKGAAVLSSRGYIISDALKYNNISTIKLIGLDLTDINKAAVEDGTIDFLIGQRPNQQGFLAIETLLKYLAYGNKTKQDNYMPLDIITRENLNYYLEYSE